MNDRRWPGTSAVLVYAPRSAASVGCVALGGLTRPTAREIYGLAAGSEEPGVSRHAF